MFKKYSLKERKRLHKRIKELITEGVKPRDLHKILNQDGFTAADGEPLTERQALCQLNQAGGKKRILLGKSKPKPKRAAPAEITTAGNDDLEPLFDLVLDANLDDQTKINLIKSIRAKQGSR